MSWQPVTLRDDPAAHIRYDVLPFVLTPADRSKVALYQAEAIAAVRRQNERDAMHGLATWKGAMHRVGEALPQ